MTSVDEDGKALMMELRDQIASYSKLNSKETQAVAKPILYAALHDLLRHISVHEIPETTRLGVDEELSTKHATVLKWGLLRGLQYTDLARSYLGLPRTLEQTRIFLCSISAGKTTDILQDELGKGIDNFSSEDGDDVSADNADELKYVVEVMTFMTGHGRFKKDLNGADLSKDAKRICRTVINKAKTLEKGLRKKILEHRKGQKPSGPKTSKEVWIDRDVRVEDRESEERRKQAYSLNQYL